jgi:hypothetical protein
MYLCDIEIKYYLNEPTESKQFTDIRIIESYLCWQ